MQVYILTEGGDNSGLGHIMRCSALYHAFREKGISPLMVVDGDAEAEKALTGKNYLLKDWKADDIEVQEEDLIVIDSYQAGEDIYYHLARQIKLLVCLDDTNRMNYPPGIVLNSLMDAEKLYSPREQISYLLGTEYALLRRSFQKNSARMIRPQIKDCMITLGGQDQMNLMPEMIKHLQSTYPHLLIKAVIGNSFKNRAEIEQIKGENTILVDSPDGEEMAALMTDADLAISAGGQTLFELACLGTPSLAIALAENQVNQIMSLEKAGITCGVGSLLYKDKLNWDVFLGQLDGQIDKLAGLDIRTAMSKRGCDLIDGKGSIRAVEKILEIFAGKPGNE